MLKLCLINADKENGFKPVYNMASSLYMYKDNF